jgi:hypothetical protein
VNRINHDIKGELVKRLSQKRPFGGVIGRELAQYCVDQIWNELDIKETRTAKFIDAQAALTDGDRYYRYMEESLRAHMADFIAKNSINEIAVVRPQKIDPLDNGRMEMRTLIITRMPMPDIEK